MKLSSVVALLSVFALPAFATQVYVTYDNFYDNSATSLSQVACSNGANGLLTKGYTTFGSLPSFPNIGGIPNLTWNSALCGTCWNLKYTTPTGKHESIYITAVDAAYTYNLSLEAFNKLTDNTGVASGKVSATATQVATSFCGM
ncbi:Cerato-platanin [Suillus clintonianus]|uniref:Cerato-platanin n=1 Tax=Suillus clintonianus TaxID=1904413 RepID=UPI001B887260|nr:Cerato-platanin [Suillus clintonianus]KAG2129116.1 Cerato-platanin [Suillus clintonianus]